MLLARHIRMSNVGGNDAGIYAYSVGGTHIYSLTRQDSLSTGTLDICSTEG